MILSLPNSGTDWLCAILAKHGRELRYFEKEFFNPICNQHYAPILETAFGCELASSYRNIAWRGRDPKVAAMEDVYQATWAGEAFNFDKENFSAMKVEFFARHFRLAFLYRSAANVFPPSRLRVWAWYDAIYQALVDVGGILPANLGARTLAERAQVAHAACWTEMRYQAEILGVPIIDYEVLCTEDKQRVLSEIGRGWIKDRVDVEAAADEIMATRQYTPKVPIEQARRLP
jgi:hypothetical protein